MPVTLIRVILGALVLGAGWSVFQQKTALDMVRHQSDTETVRKAIDRDPNRASLHFSLGVAHRDNIDLWNLEEAIKHLERSVELNPYNWRYWLELARTSELAGNPTNAEKAYLRTLELNPHASVYKWRIANFYLRSERPEKAKELLKEALVLDPSYTEPVFSILLKLDSDRDVLQNFWLDNREIRLRILKYLSDRDTLPSQAASFFKWGWGSLLTDPAGLDIDTGDFYIRHLLRAGRHEEARFEWTRLLELNGIKDESFNEGRNRVWNGDFENPLVRNSLGWHFRISPELSFRRDVEASNAGYALNMSFASDSNPDFKAASQRLLVEPGREYRLRYDMRTQGVTTEQGFFLEIISSSGDRLLQCRQLGGTSAWQSIEGRFLVPETVPEVYLRVRRLPSRRLDNALKGQIWLDSVEVSPIEAEESSVQKEGPLGVPVSVKREEERNS